jgi:hypothetical protein
MQEIGVIPQGMAPISCKIVKPLLATGFIRHQKEINFQLVFHFLPFITIGFGRFIEVFLLFAF